MAETSYYGWQVVQTNSKAKTVQAVTLPDDLHEVIYAVPQLEEWVKKLNHEAPQHISYELAQGAK